MKKYSLICFLFVLNAVSYGYSFGDVDDEVAGHSFWKELEEHIKERDSKEKEEQGEKNESATHNEKTTQN